MARDLILPLEGSLKSFPRFDPDILRKAFEILEVIHRYRSPLPAGAVDRYDEGNLRFVSIIYGRVRHSKHIEMVLPAFPFKSPNHVDKTLGNLPDKGEELALSHLNGLCAAITDIYEPGAMLTVASDGLVYCDLLGVSESEVWHYGQTLRDMAAEKKLKHIEFTRLRNILHWKDDMMLDEETYTSLAPSFRQKMVDQYTPLDHDADKEIGENEDICTTYRGYIKFLDSDLAHMASPGDGISKTQRKKGYEKIAKKMITRGAAFAEAILKNFPNHVRLSIHPSNGSKKISISVLPTTGNVARTPWHAAPCYNLDGSFDFKQRHELDNRDDLELVYKNGRPWMYRAKSDLFNFPFEADVEPLYPCGIMVRPLEPTSLTQLDMQQVRQLSHHNSPVVIRGLSDTLDKELYVKKAEEMGIPLSWKFGLILEVMDHGKDSRGLNNVLSAEWMPFHYDGLFKVRKEIDADGKEKTISLPPRYQFFTSTTPSPEDTGFTLFTPSRLVFKNLPAKYSLEQLSKLTWNVATTAFDETVMKNLPLVESHFATGEPCLRYHEPWPQSKTAFDPTEIEINDVDDSAGLCQVIDSLLHDRRLCLWHSWEKGDCLVSDNINMMHTRSSFNGGSDRCLRRIHVD